MRTAEEVSVRRAVLVLTERGDFVLLCSRAGCIPGMAHGMDGMAALGDASKTVAMAPGFLLSWLNLGFG